MSLLFPPDYRSDVPRSPSPSPSPILPSDGHEGNGQALGDPLEVPCFPIEVEGLIEVGFELDASLRRGSKGSFSDFSNDSGQEEEDKDEEEKQVYLRSEDCCYLSTTNAQTGSQHQSQTMDPSSPAPSPSSSSFIDILPPYTFASTSNNRHIEPNHQSPSSTSPLTIVATLPSTTPAHDPSSSRSRTRFPSDTSDQSTLSTGTGTDTTNFSANWAHHHQYRLLERDHTNRLSASFITLFSPTLGHQFHRSSTTSNVSIIAQAHTASGSLRIEPRPRLQRSRSAPLLSKSTDPNHHHYHSRASSLLYNMVPGQSSFDFGDSVFSHTTSPSSAWRGLRRALSLNTGSSGSAHSSSSGRRSSKLTASTARMSRQLMGVTSVQERSGTGSDQHDHHHHQVSEPVGFSEVAAEQVGTRRQGSPKSNEESGDSSVIVKHQHQRPIGLNTSAFGSVGSFGTTSTMLSRDRDQEAPSGPSSPCDTDRFSLSDWSNIPFPKPPSLIPPRSSPDLQLGQGVIKNGDEQGQQHDIENENELTITIHSPFAPFAHGHASQAVGRESDVESPPSHVDESPTDPHFPFHSSTVDNSVSRLAKPTTPVSVCGVTYPSETAYCPPSPALTPSPHLSSTNSPVLITPGIRPSPSQPSSPLLQNGHDEDHNNIVTTPETHNNKAVRVPDLTQTPTKHTTVPLLDTISLSPLTPETVISASPAITPKSSHSHSHPSILPSSSTPPLSHVQAETYTITKIEQSPLVSASTIAAATVTSDLDLISPRQRTISAPLLNNNSSTSPSLDDPIVLRNIHSKAEPVLDQTNTQNSGNTERQLPAAQDDSMAYSGLDRRQGRERDWAYDNQVTLDPQPTQITERIPPPSHPFHHHKPQPSVPYSTRTVSTLGHNSRLSVDPTESLSPPPSYGHFSSSSGSRRNSKYTAFSGSSGSSIHSYSTTDSSSYRAHNQQWHVGERPDISTVFEENSVDAEGDCDNPDHEDDQHPGTKKELYDFDGPLKSRQNSLSGHPRYPTLRTQTSSNTLVDRPSSRSTPGYFSRERSSTVNSANGTITSTGSNKSTNKPVHPFANAVVRPASPPALPSSKSHNDFLSPQHHRRPGSPTLQSSRSSPNLADSYKMSQPTHQVTLVSTEDDKDDEETCPVCVESLSFTYRLPGEKPHIVPECGHALHEECFVTVYGDVPAEGSKKVLGVCGVCRQPMKMADGATKRDKLAMLMGQPGQNVGRKPSQSAPSVRSANGRGQPSSPSPIDPNADDPLEDRAISSSRSMQSESSQPKVVVPSISIRSEFPSIAKGHRKGKQVITAMVTVEVPPAENKGRYPPKARPNEMSRTASHEDQFSPQLPPSPRSASDSSVVPSTARSGPVHSSTPDPFAHVVHDLRHRVVDYKTSGLDQLGSLKLFDLLCVRKGQLVREFHVYLFQEALICVSEERKTGLRGIFSSSSSIRSDHSNGSHHGRGVLKLKGRIYVRHVRQVIDTSVPGELSLTITMEDESLDSFILCFKDRSSHETWRSTINRLLEEVKGGSQNKVQRMLGSAAPRSANGSLSANGSALGMSFGDLASPSTAGFAVTPASSTFTHSEPTPGDLAYEQPLAPVHTPVDLVVVLSLPAPSSSSQLPLKVKLMKSSLSFVLALLGPKDRISLVTCEMGTNGLVRKTPFLSPCRYESRKRLEAFIETLGTGRTTKDGFEVSVGRDERFDVVTAVNVALDVVLQRKVKNPISGMVLISDTSDIIKRAQMDLVTARLDAANVPVHALGYGRSHDPSPLWMISNHTHGTYTFVKEWYHLRDSLAGVVGGLLSIAMDNMKLHLSCQENDFHVTKVSGTTSAIVSKNGKDVDIELRELRHGEIREILVELDLEVEDGSGSNERRYSGDGSSESGRLSEQRADGSQNGSSIRKASSFNVEHRGLGLDTLSVGDANALRDVVYEDALIDEVPVVEVDCSFHDPGAGRSVARLAHPVLLTVAILPSNAPPSSSPADPMIVRRRMELLASDMITRALLIASRKNFTHASRILRETKRIIETIIEGLRAHVSHVNGQMGKSKREVQTLCAVEGLMGTVQDLDMLLDGLEEHKEMFERDHRNYSAQQAGVLRAQRSWTTRTPTERAYATKEVQNIINLGGEWQGRS
ncbi:hypothetical protein IAU59_000270 [Kwoniella sp. CBS 9459]